MQTGTGSLDSEKAMKHQLVWNIENIRPDAVNLAHCVGTLELNGMEQEHM